MKAQKKYGIDYLKNSPSLGQSQPLRIEGTQHIQLITVKTQGNALWFVNNKLLERLILTYLARYCAIYQVELFAFSLMGNHYHLLAKFINNNQARFMQQFNARIAELVRHLVKVHPGGSVLKHHYSSQYIPLDTDVLHYFLYCAGQAVSSGLAKSISDYPGYNSYQSAVKKEVTTFRWVDRTAFNRAKRSNNDVCEEDFAIYYDLKYQPLPGLEKLPDSEYQKKISRQLKEYLNATLLRNEKAGVKYPSISKLYEIKPGSQPKTTKASKLTSYRPIVLCSCARTKAKILDWYFGIFYAYKSAISSFIAGHISVPFPKGTFRPFSLA